MSDHEAPPPADPALPFAIVPEHFAWNGRSRWRNLGALLIIGGVLAAALSGRLGGGPSQVQHAAGLGLSVDLTYDPIMRSGNWFEMTMDVRSQHSVKDLVVSVDRDLWRKMSIDTIAPDAERAESLNGRYSYHFGEVKPGERFRLKLDGQIQAGMLRTQRGQIEVRDGTRTLLALPVKLTVLP